jgi:cytochrome c-type biogenesis protein
MITLLLAFLAGLLTIVSPCVLPLAPIVIAGARAKDARGPLALAAGLAISFGLFGGILATFSIELGDIGFIRTFAAVLMVVFGLVMLVPALGMKSEYWLGPLAQFADAIAQKMPQIGLTGQFFAGVVLAFAWAPCVGPTLGAAFALAASGGSLIAAMAVMGVFALGSASALLLAGYGLSRIAAKGKRWARQSAKIGSILLASVLIVIGIAIITGVDKAVEGLIVAAMPDWLVLAATKL